MFANLNGGSKGTNSNDIELNSPIPSDNGNDKNKMIRDDDDFDIADKQMKDFWESFRWNFVEGEIENSDPIRSGDFDPDQMISQEEADEMLQVLFIAETNSIASDNIDVEDGEAENEALTDYLFNGKAQDIVDKNAPGLEVYVRDTDVFFVKRLENTEVVDLNIDDPLSESSSPKKIQAMLLKLEDENSVISTREMNYIKNTINRDSKPGERSPVADELLERFSEVGDGFAIDQEANNKGEEFLKRKRVFERELGEREQAVIEDFKEFRLDGFFDSGNQFVTFYVPLWRAVSNDDSSFQYYFSGGEVNIIG